jgi:DNA/RNA endonuclease YhcR with UshA esterase domain
MAISPAEAINRANQQVAVEMLVQAAKNCPHCLQIFLDSETDHHDLKNLAVAVTEIGKAKFKEAKIDDPAGHFQGKTIRVTGTVILRENRPHIEVNDPQQIEMVEGRVTE